MPLPPLETERVDFWMGMILQAPPPAIAWQQGIPAKGVYVSCKHPGSPSGRMSMPPTSRIEEVDGVPTPDLEAPYCPGPRPHSEVWYGPSVNGDSEGF